MLTFGLRKSGRFYTSLALLILIGIVTSCGGGASPGGVGGSGGGGGGGGSSSASFSLTVQATADGVTKSVGSLTVTVP
jgi:hypothetical protein